MTARENNFCCATDLAPMSEPGVYGAGTIGIVSNRFYGQTVQTKRDYDHQDAYEVRVRSVELCHAPD
jgi:hypothetical protein